jgi:hypothetical protein
MKEHHALCAFVSGTSTRLSETIDEVQDSVINLCVRFPLKVIKHIDSDTMYNLHTIAKFVIANI